MINPTTADIGRAVIYRHRGQAKEFGSITSFNEKYVFVLYEGAAHAAATNRLDLEWLPAWITP